MTDSLVLDVTSRCNLSCAFCYEEEKGDQDMANPEIVIVKYKPKRLVISGGEPMLRQDLKIIVDSSLERGVERVRIVTNGTSLDNDIMRLDSEKRGSVSFFISLHASSREKYIEVCGQDHFDNVLNNIQRVKSLFDTIVGFSVYSGNFECLDGMIALAKKHDFRLMVNPVFPIGRGRDVSLITQEQMKELKRKVFVYRACAGIQVDSTFTNPAYSSCMMMARHYNKAPSARCCEGKVYVSVSGRVRDCEYKE